MLLSFPVAHKTHEASRLYFFPWLDRLLRTARTDTLVDNAGSWPPASRLRPSSSQMTLWPTMRGRGLLRPDWVRPVVKSFNDHSPVKNIGWPQTLTAKMSHNFIVETAYLQPDTLINVVVIVSVWASGFDPLKVGIVQTTDMRNMPDVYDRKVLCHPCHWFYHPLGNRGESDHCTEIEMTRIEQYDPGCLNRLRPDVPAKRMSLWPTVLASKRAHESL